ncbi:amino acid ABC transporter substrate-binding protein [Clostridia bacterium]|nr:amino acid ABC transporter substrate-binding protein [Clostridia bacterium]
MKIKNIIAVTLIGATALFTLAACGSAGAESGVTTVRVGTGNAYPPYAYQNESGDLIGYEKAVLDAVDAKLPQYSFKYQIFEFKNILTALAADKIDLGAHQFEENAERRSNYLFSEVGYNDYTSYIAFLEGGTPYETLKELEGKTIMVSPGSNFSYIIDQYNQHEAETQIATSYFEANYDLLAASLETGTAEATLMTAPDIERWNNMREKKLAHSKEPAYISQSYFLFKNGNTELQQAVDGALRELKDSGELDKIYEENVKKFYESFE